MANYNNYFSIDSYEITHKGKRMVTNLNSDRFESFINDLEVNDYIAGIIPPGYEHRADLISDLFYNTPIYDWLICWANNIRDPFNELNIGDSIKIPRI